MLEPAPCYILVCLFAGNGLANIDSSLLIQIPDIINHLCPGSSICLSNRSSETANDISLPPGRESCCADCSCTVHCSKTDNCCFPKATSSKKDTTENVRNHRSCLYPMFPQPVTNQHLYQSFLMVSSVQNISSYIPEKSSNLSCGERNVTLWGSLYPVYSAKTNKIYKNIECAWEEGEDNNAIIWDAIIDCEDKENEQGITFATAGIDTRSIPENCRVYFKFPGSYDVLQSLKCYTNLIDTCSKTRDFQIPDGTNLSQDVIRTLCTESGFVSPYRKYKIYANVFCHICNQIDGVDFQPLTFCDKLTDDGSVKGGSDGRFVALLDQKFITEKKETHYGRKYKVSTACFDTNEESCRKVFCPTGQVRDMTSNSKCVYPNKIWYNQNYAVYINLTLDTFFNVTEAFNIESGSLYSTVPHPLKSVWLNKWIVHSVYYRVTDVPRMSNNVVIITHRKLPSVKPDTIVGNVKRIIVKPWSMRLNNATQVIKSVNFSVIRALWKYDGLNKEAAGDIYNLTNEYLDVPQYRLAYSKTLFLSNMELPITRSYMCDQVELRPSEFLLSNDQKLLYSLTTKRFFFDADFMITYSNSFSERRARICVEDSGLFIKNENTAANCKTFDTGIALSRLMFILLMQSLYNMNGLNM